MTSKLLRIVPMVLSLSIPAVAVAADAPPAGDAKHDTKDAKKKKGDEKKDEKKAEEKKDEKK